MNADVFEAIHRQRAGADIDSPRWRLRHDTRFADEMAVCQLYQIAHSRLLREWDPDDIDKAIAKIHYDRERCSDCGVHPDDWPTDAHDEEWEVHAYRCHGCKTLAEFWSQHRDKSERETAGAKASLRRHFPWLQDLDSLTDAEDRFTR